MIWVVALAAAPAVPPGEEAIVITAERGAGRVQPPVAEIGAAELAQRQPRSASEAVDDLPGVLVRTNSRGETIARLRGGDERQTAIFLDGTPLAVPWDGRADIGILPAGLIGRAAVAKGAVAVDYGTNVVAGAVDLQSVSGSGAEADFRASASLGTLGFAEAAAVALLPLGAVRLTFAGGLLTRDAEPVARRSALPFSQADSSRRTNSDLDSASLFGAASWSRGAVSVRGFLLHARASRGIAPESNRDPAVDAPRYWRYPRIEQTQAGLTGRVELGPASHAQLVLWRQWFGQRIVQYADQEYDQVRATQDDDDDTVGGRLRLATRVGAVGVRLVASASTSRHAQVDRAVSITTPGLALVYRQLLLTIGGEADVALGLGRATVGLAYDHVANPLTGDKSGQPARGAAAFSAAWAVGLGGGLELGLSGGRRNRFPTLREAYGEALGRFLPNPDLRPERAWVADAELSWRGRGATLSANPFASRLDDAIAQMIVTVGGRRLRQRVNLAGSWSYGMEVAGRAALSPRLAIEGDATLLRARADRGTLPFRDLVQRPWLDATLAAAWRPAADWSLRAELHHVGVAYDLAPDGGKARLKAGTELNLRGQVALARAARGRLWLAGSVDNVTNALITPLLGLPLAGRSVRVGFRIE